MLLSINYSFSSIQYPVSTAILHDLLHQGTLAALRSQSPGLSTSSKLHSNHGDDLGKRWDRPSGALLFHLGRSYLRSVLTTDCARLLPHCKIIVSCYCLGIRELDFNLQADGHCIYFPTATRSFVSYTNGVRMVVEGRKCINGTVHDLNAAFQEYLSTAVLAIALGTSLLSF